MDIIAVSLQHISCVVSHIDSGVRFIVSFVYASNKSVERARLWNDVSEEAVRVDEPWFILGDFNAITHEEEKKGGQRFENKSASDFRNFILANGLLDAGFSGNKFTWSNNQRGPDRIWMRLDRVLINGVAAGSFPAIKVVHLPRVHSDHCPILVSFSRREECLSFFSFNPAWINHKDFMKVVEEQWEGRLSRNPLLNCHLKLKKLRKFLRSWNWEVFGNFHRKISDIMTRIEATGRKPSGVQV